MASSGRTATTKAMGKGSTQFQHLVQTEVPPRLLEEWLKEWAGVHGINDPLSGSLRPHTPGSEILELRVDGIDGETCANVVFSVISDRRGRVILMVRDQNTIDEALRRKRLMTLLHLFLLHRYKIDSVHYLTPTDDNLHQTASMQASGMFESVTDEVGGGSVADGIHDTIQALGAEDGAVLSTIITRD